MANVQKRFEQFNDTIRLKRFEDNQTLREKRDIVRNKLKDRLPQVFADHKEESLEPRFRDQGSYEMGTGIKPLRGDYDIDQGVYFDVSTEDEAYKDPVTLKKRVHEALEGHTKRVEIRRSCVTVFYQKDDEPIYHVDLAVYSAGSANADGKSRLAKGKVGSSEENNFWEISRPQELAEAILSKFTDEAERAQFRRLVRYLKRWRDEKFSSDGNGKPSGIALTVAVSDLLQPIITDTFSGTADDLTALTNVVRSMIAKFSYTISKETGNVVERLEVKLPIEPNGDLFERMTDTQMEAFKERLEVLLESLKLASELSDEIEACKELRRQFGDDFPVPEEKEASRVHGRAIVSSSSSA